MVPNRIKMEGKKKKKDNQPTVLHYNCSITRLFGPNFRELGFIRKYSPTATYCIFMVELVEPTCSSTIIEGRMDGWMSLLG